jgi:hypothetical protein
MAVNKTVATKVSVATFIAGVSDATRRAEAQTISRMMQDVTGFKPAMWGPTIIGFGHYHYRYDSGHEGDMPMVAFSPRKPELVLYLASGYPAFDAIRQRLGKHKMSKACIYVKRLADIDVDALRELIAMSYDEMRKRYGDDGMKQAGAAAQTKAKTPAAGKASRKAAIKKGTTKPPAAKKRVTKPAKAKPPASKSAGTKQRAAVKKTSARKSNATRKAVTRRTATRTSAKSTGLAGALKPARTGGGAAPRKAALRQRAAAEAARSRR